jgi:hypothetical protein
MLIGDAYGGGRQRLALGSEREALRVAIIAAATCSSLLFIVVGVRYGLQMYADGSMFSYSVAVEDAWKFHWHNISGRMFVFLFLYVPAQAYVHLTMDAHGGIALYGLLFFAAPLLGLIATYAMDRSMGRIIFSYACLSTVCLCPLVFGFPTEVWISHALFWPTLALSHYARGQLAGALVFAGLLALILTHAGALILAVVILMTLLLRGPRDPAFLRALGCFFLAVAIWLLVLNAFPADPLVAEMMWRAALHVFDPAILAGDLVLLLLATLAGYAIAFALFRRLAAQWAHIHAGAIVVAALAVYWLWFDHALHADNRYYLRTVLLVATPALGALAGVHALAAEGRLDCSWTFLPPVVRVVSSKAATRFAAGAVALIMLVHVVETAKFVSAWNRYTGAVRALATGSLSDPALGDARFVSSQRLGNELNRLSWFSTTPYLSVLLAPDFAPSRLVIDPRSNYFWLTCRTASANAEADRAIPAESRRLVQREACLHGWGAA